MGASGSLELQLSNLLAKAYEVTATTNFVTRDYMFS